MEQWSNGAMEQGSVSQSREESYNFRNLALWQRGQELTLRIVKLTESLPATVASRTIGRQIVASAGSIGANIAEGHGRYSVAAYRNHLSIARGSVAETDSWLDLLQRSDYIPSPMADELHEQCLTLLKGLTRQMRALEEKLDKGKAHRVREQPEEYFTPDSDSDGG